MRIACVAAVLCADAPIVHAQTPVERASNVTITARRITTPLRIDARFDDEMYQEASPFAEFVQQDPREGEPASERTERRVAFDDENIYFDVKCYHTDPGRINGSSDTMSASVRLRWEYRPAASCSWCTATAGTR